MDAAADTSRDVPGLVDRLFRREAGRLTATMARYLGPGHLGLAEDIAQETLARALRVWPFRGIPDDPVAWLHAVARRLTIDALRRDAALARHAPALALDLAQAPAASEASFADELVDDELRLLFMCAHPDLSADMRTALVLKTGCGLSVDEIAAGLLRDPATVAQWLVRAKKRIRTHGLSLDMPAPDALPARLATVLDAIYLAFSEGWSASAGDQLVRADICLEMLALAERMARHPITGTPATQALHALLAFQAARLATRTDADGNLMLLAEQDRALWDRDLIARGLAAITQAAAGQLLSEYHLLAGIAAEHAIASSFESTNWNAIRAYYDLLVDTNPSPVHRLNRVVALAMASGPEAGLGALAELENDPALRGFRLLHATRGELLRRAGRNAEAHAAFRHAFELARSEPERRFLRRRLA
ncbi:RNA polymerase sigma factor [Vineibacter terrae]|uniref:RNA polymerase sigma factor n=1 Tax=Vineibacter terrae TaxID=2586908 RepID=UPI002E344CAD|nr:sigma-70 family RNA polymerase sigma factor [Vineibacter terrae]HEX2888866.1 sigma-70 family RNA polymerase sigma factor [Vineibacter terrae]